MIRKFLLFSSITTISRMLTGIFIVFILARILSLKDFGIYMYGVVVANIITMLVEYGYNTLLVKELAQRKDVHNYVIFTTLIKISIFIFSIIILFLYLKLNNFTIREIYVILFITFAVVLNSFIVHFMIPFKIIDRFDIESKFALINNLTTFIVVFTVVYLSKNLLLISLSFFLIKLINVCIVFVVYLKNFATKIFFKFKILKELKKATPYALMTLIGGLYMSADTLIIKHFLDMKSVGIYRGGINIILAATFIITIVNNVALPQLSKNLKNIIVFKYIASKYNFFVFLFSIIIGLVVFCFDKLIISILYGEKFFVLTKYIYLIVGIVILKYIENMYGIILSISDKQIIRVIGVGFSLIVVLILDYITIPKFGIVIAYINLFLGHILLLIIYTIFIYKNYKSLLFYDFLKGKLKRY